MWYKTNKLNQSPISPEGAESHPEDWDKNFFGVILVFISTTLDNSVSECGVGTVLVMSTSGWYCNPDTSEHWWTLGRNNVLMCYRHYDSQSHTGFRDWQAVTCPLTKPLGSTFATVNSWEGRPREHAPSPGLHLGAEVCFLPRGTICIHPTLLWPNTVSVPRWPLLHRSTKMIKNQHWSHTLAQATRLWPGPFPPSLGSCWADPLKDFPGKRTESGL